MARIAEIFGRLSSPRPWRCFRRVYRPAGATAVFSTPVEVFPAPRPSSRMPHRLLHARGGVSGSSNGRDKG